MTKGPLWISEQVFIAFYMIGNMLLHGENAKEKVKHSECHDDGIANKHGKAGTSTQTKTKCWRTHRSHHQVPSRAHQHVAIPSCMNCAVGRGVLLTCRHSVISNALGAMRCASTS